MTAVVEGSGARYKPLIPKAKAAILAALDFVEKKQAHLEVFLVSNMEIRRLNRHFRGKDKPTNVLSFGSVPGFPSPVIRRPFLGEIFLAPDYASRRGESVARLLVHGFLHLLGYTHAGVRGKIKMEALQARIEAHLKKKEKYF